VQVCVATPAVAAKVIGCSVK